jgi:hypothetical protein
MKRSCLILFIFCNMSVANDKFEHFITSYAGSFTIAQVTKEPVLAFFSMLAIGAAKELFIDKRPDKADMIYNTLGTMVGVGVSIAID